MGTDRIIKMAKTNSNNIESGRHNGMGLTKAKAEQIVTVRVLLLVIFDIAVSFWFDSVVNAPGQVEYDFYMNTRPTLIWVFSALFVLSAAYAVIAKLIKLKTFKHFITPEMLVAMTFICASAVVLYNNFRLTPILFYTMMVVISILAAIYYIYTMLFY